MFGGATFSSINSIIIQVSGISGEKNPLKASRLRHPPKKKSTVSHTHIFSLTFVVKVR